MIAIGAGFGPPGWLYRKRGSAEDNQGAVMSTGVDWDDLSAVMVPLSPTGSALARTDLSPLTNGNWVIHAEYSCFLHPPFLAKIGYIP